MPHSVRLIALLILLLGTGLSPAWAARLDGHYQGIAEGTGMSLTLEELDGRVVGKLVMAEGEALALNGERSAKGAQGSLRIKGAVSDSAFFLLEERPRGVQILIMPARDDGTPDASAGRQYSLMRDGVGANVPLPGSGRTMPAPEAPVDVIEFIDGYRNWSAQDGARLYATLDDQSRGVMLLFDFASADILWRLCEAPSTDDQSVKVLAEALERQQIDCAQYLPFAKTAQKSSLYPEFLRRARFQMELVRATILCHRGQSPADKCNDVAALTTPLILRWRKAIAIMQEMSGATPQAEVEARVKDALIGTPPLRQTLDDKATTDLSQGAHPASGQPHRVPLARPHH